MKVTSLLNYPPQFQLSTDEEYQQWRKNKLEFYTSGDQLLVTAINDFNHLNTGEMESLHRCLKNQNFALYRLKNIGTQSKTIPMRIAEQLGLRLSDKHLCGDQDGLSEIQVSQKPVPGEYIPYSNKAINWHTDGYYNSDDKKIHTMILHCANDAVSGGDNGFFDHDIIYILLRDENPDYISALMQEDVMTIPENRQNGQLIRSEQTGAVFSLYPWGLHMRYTARTKSIVWKDQSIVSKAITKISEILNSDSPYKVRYRLNPGEGIISNNVLHMRDAFEDSENEEHKRLIYRMRFYQRIEEGYNGRN